MNFTFIVYAFVFLKVLLFNNQRNSLRAQYNLQPHLQLEKCLRWKKKCREGEGVGSFVVDWWWWLVVSAVLILLSSPHSSSHPSCTHTH